ncbi:biotin--[acetyl-CoA-carboxylase] ligase [Candidatus Coxiella mudrowiae]|uniref:biotin--[acetyl-CoA-carboxylase] ligase n=1 Tax=Candidatus Coxiella mudrowiae TaxID=2054173 RepID=UPI001FCF9F1B|nr:biotin--[acetyl-CoA-carboxylase] ligase [Candidatus Coxiella mudrowiae]
MEIHKKLKNYQIPIKSLKTKGYCLAQPLTLLDKQKIVSTLEIKSIPLELFKQVDSTNDYLKTASHPKSHPNKLAICISEMQTKGKGRFYRPWHSPFGQNIYLSLKYSFDKDISELAGLSLVCGLVVCRTIETICHLSLPIFIKWPNDIICDNKKLAGILIEIQAETHEFCSVIIGIGLNVNMQNDADQKINKDWTSLINLTEAYYDRNKLCTALINYLIHYLETFEKHGFRFFQNPWREKDYLFNKFLSLKSNQNEFQGIGAGINEKGNLILKLTDGFQKAFSSGDATLK